MKPAEPGAIGTGITHPPCGTEMIRCPLHGVSYCNRCEQCYLCQREQLVQDPALATARSNGDRPAMTQEDTDRAALRYDTLSRALINAEQLDTIPEPEPLIDDLLDRDALGWLYGKPGAAKTFVAVDMACCVATGRDWHDHKTHQGPVLYIAAEGVRGIRRRVRAWETAAGKHVGDDLVFLPLAPQLLEPPDLDAVKRIITERAPMLVVVDTQARVSLGAEENSARDMGRLIAAIDEIRRAAGSCILLVHHEPRNAENLRGSTALEGAADTVIRVSKDGPLVRVGCAKQKDDAEFEPIILRLSPLETSAVLSHEGVGLMAVTSQSEHDLLGTLRDSFGTNGASSTQLLAASGLPKTSFYRALNVLVTKGVVVNVGTKRRTHFIAAVDQQDELGST